MKTAKVLILRVLFRPLELLVQAINFAFTWKTGFQSQKIPKAPGLKFLLLAVGVLGVTLAAARAGADEAVPWVSAMQGNPDTLFLQHGNQEWFRATLNTPIKAGDNLWLDAGGKAEIFLNANTFVRLEGTASLRFDTLEQTSFDLAQNMGQAIHQTGSDSWIYLMTPQLGITLHPNSRVRIAVAEDESTEVTTQRGEAEISGPAGYASVRAGQSLYLAAGANSYNLSAAPPADELDQWSDQRDRQLASATSSPAPATQYLPPPVAYDLSYHGFWLNDPIYGWCWRPRVMAVGWAPYRVGRWMWEPAWGWTWISYEPWGWYPYHYGRWAVSGSGWLWVPQPFLAVAWSPALVFWLDGPDWIGWCPIPPHVDITVVHRDPKLVYKYVTRNNITIVNVNHFNQTNYIRYNRPLPRNFRARTVPVVNPRHEFRHVRDTREFMTPEPRGWVKPERQPPRRLAERVPPAWETRPRPERGPGERPEITRERPLPPGRGKERTPPANPREIERPGRGPGEVAPPGQIKERPERPAPPGREEKPGKGREPGIERPGQGPREVIPPGQIKERPERPAPPGREEKPGKGVEPGIERPGQGPREVIPPGPVQERPERPSPPGREQGPAGGPPPSPPGREQGPAGGPPPSPPGREQGPAGGPPPSPRRKGGTPKQETPPTAPSAPGAPGPAQPPPGRGEGGQPGQGPEKARPQKRGQESRNYFFSPFRAFEGPGPQSFGSRQASERQVLSLAPASRTGDSLGNRNKGRAR